MDISFKTRKLQKICSEEKEMQKQLGTKCAGKLQQRLMELKAADTLSDISYLPPPRCHELAGHRAGQFSIDVEHPYRLLFVPANNPIPRHEDGGIDRNQVTEIEIIEIADTH
jgi:plasmid maintenance system killer protein